MAELLGAAIYKLLGEIHWLMETPPDSLFDMIVKQRCFTHEMGQRMALATYAEKHEMQSQKMQRSKFNPCTWHHHSPGILEMWHLHRVPLPFSQPSPMFNEMLHFIISWTFLYVVVQLFSRVQLFATPCTSAVCI